MKKLLIAFMVTVAVTPAFARVKLRAGDNNRCFGADNIYTLNSPLYTLIKTGQSPVFI